MKIKKLKLITVFFVSLLFCLVSCKKENIVSVRFVFENDNKIHLGDKVIQIPKGCDFAFDEVQNKLWLHEARRYSSLFTCFNSDGEKEKSFSLNYEQGAPMIGGPGIFVSDGVALIPEMLFKGNHFFLVDLNKKTYQLVKVDFDFCLISDFYDKKMFVTMLGDVLGVYDFVTNEFTEIKEDLQGYGFIPEKHVLVGLNDEGKICIQDYLSDSILNTNIKGLKDRDLGVIRERYYVTDKYLYFAKKDVGYSIKYFIPRLIGSFTCLSNGKIPHVWYRYSLADGKIEKIKTDDPFIEILGVIED
ncbi:MAG: hypothetical protein J6Y60_01630 [Treponema sp.]|nr:hypothetical protein [Treponema sp.]